MQVEIHFGYITTLAAQLRKQKLQWKNANWGKMFQQDMEFILILHGRGILTEKEKHHALDRLMKLILKNVESKQPKTSKSCLSKKD